MDYKGKRDFLHNICNHLSAHSQVSATGILELDKITKNSGNVV